MKCFKKIVSSLVVLTMLSIGSMGVFASEGNTAFVKITPDILEMSPDTSTSINATFNYFNGQTDVTEDVSTQSRWVSLDSSVVTVVVEDGIPTLHALKEGKAEIKVMYQMFSNIAEVTVKGNGTVIPTPEPKLSDEEAWNLLKQTTGLKELFTLQVGNPRFTYNGKNNEIDIGRGTTPVVIGDRTLIPIRAIIETLGGTVGWDEASQTITINCQNNNISMIIGNTNAKVNGKYVTLDVAPQVVNDRTMLPLRFVGESLGYTVKWDNETNTASLSK